MAANPFAPKAPKFQRQVNSALQGFGKFANGPKAGKAPKPVAPKVAKRSGRGL